MIKTSVLLHYFKTLRFGVNRRVSTFNRVLRKQSVNINPHFIKYGKSRFPIALFSLVAFWETKKLRENTMSEDSNKADDTARQEAIKKADDVFTANKHEEVCDILSQFKDSGDVEVLWRIARSKYKLSSQQNITNQVKEAAICEGFDIISQALEINNQHYAVHKWMSVLLDARSELRGMKERIMQLENVKEHMLEAVKLNPNDATTYHMLGAWCYQIADMAWYQRKIASTLFASPPTSTFQEALQYFKQAEDVQPNFYSQNLLMLGKTHQKLGEQERAYYYFKLTTEYLVSSDDDLMAHKEAETLLKKMNYKPSS